MGKKTIEEKYKEMDEISHILHRPSMYVGSVKEEESQMFIYDTEDCVMKQKDVTYIPAMLKIVDEVISNSCDEYRRKDNMGLTELFVNIYPETGKVIVRDNGGIPVLKHKEAGCYLSEFIFGRLRTSSNYDDTENRTVVGTNGVGAGLTNCFSKSYKVTTADKKNKVTIEWKNNMRECIDHGTPCTCSDHFTQTEFIVDFDKFNIKKQCFGKDFVTSWVFVSIISPKYSLS